MCSFDSEAVMEVDDAAAKAALVQQLELNMDAGGQGALATAHEDRHEDEMALVDQPLGDRLAGELRPADRDVGSRALLQPPDRRGVELALDSGSLAAHRVKRPGVDNLLGRTPDLREVPGHRRLIAAGLP